MDFKQQPLSSAPTRAVPNYHLFSTAVIVAWSLFIVITLITFELAHRATWNFDRVAAQKALPWGLNVLPSILRTVFDQVHGLVTAMHLARLAVGLLDAPRASPNTWLEVFWLADRRWAGPYGLYKTLENLFFRKLRKQRAPHISPGFWFFAALSVVTLVTPVTMSRAYHVITGEVESRFLVSSVSTVDHDRIRNSTFGDDRGKQVSMGSDIWGKGLVPAMQFPVNIYSDIDIKQSCSGGAMLATGWTNYTTMTISAVQVVGGCDYFQASDVTFEELCSSTIINGQNAIFTDHEIDDKLNVRSCSNITLDAEFGRDLQSPASVLFKTWKGHFRCDITAGAGTAIVDGSSMTYRNFTYITTSTNTSSSSPGHQFYDPIAALLQSEFKNFHSAWAFRAYWDSLNDGYIPHNQEMELGSAVLWDGLVAMTASVWAATARQSDHFGVQKLTVTGIRRHNGYLYVLVAFLGIWFLGMIVSSMVLIRPAWASSLDGYAMARLLQQQPVLAGTREACLAELEENDDMLQDFRMPEWRELKSQPGTV